MNCKLQTDMQKKRSAYISISLKFLLVQIFVTLGKVFHFGSATILGWQKFGLFHIEIKFEFKYISFFRLVNSHYILSYLGNEIRKCYKKYMQKLSFLSKN